MFQPGLRGWEKERSRKPRRDVLNSTPNSVFDRTEAGKKGGEKKESQTFTLNERKRGGGGEKIRRTSSGKRKGNGAGRKLTVSYPGKGGGEQRRGNGCEKGPFHLTLQGKKGNSVIPFG